MSDRNRTLSRRWFEEVWNERRTEAIEELMSVDVLGHSESGEISGLDAFQRFREQFLTAFPDLKFVVEDLIGVGDDVVVRWSASGTHAGDALGIEPCHRHVSVRGMTWHRFKDGLLVEAWDNWNQGALLQHLSELPDVDRDRRIKRRIELAERIREVREEVFGPTGGPEVARLLGLPARTWYSYETGVTIPAEVLLDFIKESGVSPNWLRSGEGPRYPRDAKAPGAKPEESTP
ncbi:ester cyclase [Planctomyces sp. SH-PL62]|uniref:ester cyclase n=1 Tax=Planctomyces sp. SH-PL62 TaxID=1636152 RepID=UPI00078BD366|nr:ester cyclase [Planctomyces sp. SH-PL62]AMV40464.1 SnoaL-like polyketide cyclase [Planctomyces sp. SH-PL62]